MQVISYKPPRDHRLSGIWPTEIIGCFHPRGFEWVSPTRSLRSFRKRTPSKPWRPVFNKYLHCMAAGITDTWQAKQWRTTFFCYQRTGSFLRWKIMKHRCQRWVTTFSFSKHMTWPLVARNDAFLIPQLCQTWWIQRFNDSQSEASIMRPHQIHYKICMHTIWHHWILCI